MDELKKSEQKKSLLQVLKFVLFSVSAGIIQLVAFSLMNEVGKVDYWISYTVALTCSIIWNFTFNRKFTFKSASNMPKSMFLAFCFYLPFAPLSILWGNALEAAGWNEYLILGFTMVINLTTEFLWQKFVVFRDVYKQEKAAKLSAREQAINCDRSTEQTEDGEVQITTTVTDDVPAEQIENDKKDGTIGDDQDS